MSLIENYNNILVAEIKYIKNLFGTLIHQIMATVCGKVHTVHHFNCMYTKIKSDRFCSKKQLRIQEGQHVLPNLP